MSSVALWSVLSEFQQFANTRPAARIILSWYERNADHRRRNHQPGGRFQPTADARGATAGARLAAARRSAGGAEWPAELGLRDLAIVEFPLNRTRLDEAPGKGRSAAWKRGDADCCESRGGWEGKAGVELSHRSSHRVKHDRLHLGQRTLER